MDLFDHFDYLIDDERIFLMRLTSVQRRFLLSLLLASWLWGNFMKYIIYSSMKSFRKILEKPVNILIIIDQITHHVISTFLVMFYSIALVSDDPPAVFMTRMFHLSPSVFCWFSAYTSFYIFAYSSFGGLGITVYRLMYIKASNFVRFSLGEFRLLLIVGIGGVALSGLLAFLYGTGHATGRFFINFCNGQSEKFQEILLVYQGFSPNSETPMMKFSLVILLFSYFLEISCFFVIYNHINAHTNKMMENNIISIQTYKIRRQIHAFSFFGQVYSFAIQLVYILCSFFLRFVGRKFFGIDFFDLINFLRITEFGVLSSIQVISSHKMRKKLQKILSRMKLRRNNDLVFLYE